MAWFGLDQLLLGYNLDQLQAQANQDNADTAAYQQQMIDSGKWNADQAAAAQQDLQNQIANNTDVVGQVDQQFVQGAQEGLNNVLTAPGKLTGFLGDSLSTLFGGVLKNIPWWVYLVAAGALFIWMGGLELLRGRLAKGR